MSYIITQIKDLVDQAWNHLSTIGGYVYFPQLRLMKTYYQYFKINHQIKQVRLNSRMYKLFYDDKKSPLWEHFRWKLVWVFSDFKGDDHFTSRYGFVRF